MTLVRRLLITVLLPVLAGLGLLAGTAIPAEAHARRAVSYVALGDSYAAGQGGGDYRNPCLQSPYGYPGLLDSLRRIHLRANTSCTGATTRDVIDTQLGPLNRGTRLVTLTVGGNDLNVAGVAAACAAGPSVGCQQAIDAARALLAAPPGGSSVLAGRLVETYAAVAAESPRARILVTGYPRLFENPAPGDPNAPVIAAVNEATVALNATIRAAVTRVSVTGTDIRYVDVTDEFAGHGIGSPDPYLQVSGSDAFHPNRAGYRAYRSALKPELPRRF